MAVVWSGLIVTFVAMPAVPTAVTATEVVQHAAFQKALQAYRRGQFRQAEQALQQLLHAYPQSPLVLNNLAVAIARQGQHDRAAQLLKQMMSTDTILFTGYENLSVLYAYQATAAYRKALSLTVDAPEPLPLTFIGHTDKASRSLSVAQRVLADKNIDQPLVQEPETPVATVENSTIAQIKASVHRWAQAWSDQDVSNYLGSYRTSYAPPGKTHRAWRALRIRRLRAPQTIEITISNMRVHHAAPDRATVTFRQNYRSNLLASTVTKRLHMMRFDDAWRITDEIVLR